MFTISIKEIKREFASHPGDPVESLEPISWVMDSPPTDDHLSRFFGEAKTEWEHSGNTRSRQYMRRDWNGKGFYITRISIESPLTSCP
jgi:hypothetical protein